MRCFLDPRRVGAVVCCQRRVSLCRMRLPEARLGPSVRRSLGAERPSWLRGYSWGLGAEGLRAPNPASPRRRTRGEWVSGTGDPQQSSRAQGAGAAQPRFALWRAGGRGRKRLALLSRSEARWGCGLLPEESFPLQNAAARSAFGAVGATGPWRRAAELAQGAWLGPGRTRLSLTQSCFPTKENPWGVGFGHRRPPEKQQGPGSRGSPATVGPMKSGGPGAKTACIAS